MNLAHMNLSDLNDLLLEIGIRKKQLTDERARITRQAIVLVLTASGLTVDEFFAIAKAPKARQKPIQKFSNPLDLTQTWSGRGKPPKWFVAQSGAAAMTPGSLILT